MESMDLDTQIAQASETLEKIAASEGIDLDKLSSDEIAELLGDLMGLETTADAEPESKQASEETPEAPAATQPSGVTVAEVGVALQKIAAAEGIDLTQVTPEQYGEMFDNVTAYLNSPQVEQDKVAAAEMQEKLAEADLAGRQFAQSFWNELEVLGQKEAAKDEEKGEDPEKGESEKDEKDEESEKEKKANFFNKVKKLPEAIAKGEKKLMGRLGKTVRGGAEGVVERYTSPGAATGKAFRDADRAANISTGRKVVGGTVAGAGTIAAGSTALGVRAHNKKKERRELESALAGGGKESSDLEAIVNERARLMLLEGGVNPNTGTKFASDDEFVDFLATEKLRAAGYEV